MTTVYQAVVCLSEIWGDKDPVTVGVFSSEEKAEQAAAEFADAFAHVASVEVEKYVLPLVVDQVEQEPYDHYMWYDPQEGDE